jgi:O-acetyl-ADP-ribose deacetylase (regulator of RNase III)
VEIVQGDINQLAADAVVELVSPSKARGCPRREGRIIFIEGPYWRGGEDGEDEVLAAGYRDAFRLASERKAKTIAIPMSPDLPADVAAKIAVTTASAWLDAHALPEKILLVAFDNNARRVLRRALLTARSDRPSSP